MLVYGYGVAMKVVKVVVKLVLTCIKAVRETHRQLKSLEKITGGLNNDKRNS